MNLKGIFLFLYNYINTIQYYKFIIIKVKKSGTYLQLVHKFECAHHSEPL